MTVPLLRVAGQPLTMEEVTLGPPQAGEVCVRMVAAGICHSCVHAADGSHAGIPMPIVLGDEGAGVVVDTGPGCSRIRPGDHVILSWAPACNACRQCLTGHPALCQRKPPFGMMRDETVRFHKGKEAVYHFGPATYSPYVVVSEAAAIKVDDRLALDKVVLIGCAIATGVGAVINTADARAGQSLAVFGVGGVGMSAIQGAIVTGCEPIVAVDVSDRKLELARAMGATQVVNAAQGDVVQTMLDLVPEGVDIAVVAVGNETAIEQALAVLAPRATCVVVGAPATGRMIQIDPNVLRARESRIVGSSYGSCNPAVDFPKLAALYSHGRLRFDEMITRRYRLDEVNVAFDRLVSGEDLRSIITFDR